jgi:hypothetical protein
MKTIKFKVEMQDISCVDEYEELPDFVKGQIKPETQADIRKAYAVLLENPSFSAVDLRFNDWEVSKDYGGKPRHGRIAVYNYSYGVVAYMEFSNDWSGATFEADISGEVATICADLIPVKEAA